MFKSLLWGISFFFFSQAWALDLVVAPVLRNFPSSGSIEASARNEYLLWDHRDGSDAQKIFYGFVQPKMTVAAHGMWEGSLAFYPIALWEISAGVGATSRFYDSKVFECDTHVCRGVIQRQRFSTRLLGGYSTQWGQALGIVSLHQVRVSHGDDSKPLVDEVEVLSLKAGGDTFESHSVLLGLVQENKTYGLYHRKGRYRESRTENESQYLVFREKMAPEFSYGVGFGRYASDFQSAGLSATATVIWSWGQTQALF